MLSIRSISSLAAASPRTIACSVAASSVSSRRSAARCSASGPWQAKQLLARIGRMSRAKSTGCSRDASAAQLPEKPADYTHTMANKAPTRLRWRQFIVVIDSLTARLVAIASPLLLSLPGSACPEFLQVLIVLVGAANPGVAVRIERMQKHAADERRR